MKFGRSLFFAVFALALCGAAHAQFTFEKGDSVAIVGNALPDRMQHDGWMETYLHTANPDKNLVLRTLAFSGDEVAKRPREEGYPSPDDMLNLVKANVIFAFFGYNESFCRDPELFKKDLSAFIDDTLAKKYDGKGAPRIVLFSPIGYENLNSPNFPDGIEINLWLSIFTDAMARVAAEKGVTFVDLFAPTRALYSEIEEPLTINGVHLNDRGNKELAKVIVKALGQEPSEKSIDLVHAAVLDKNWNWFNRYHATDGNDVWGNRSILKFVDEQTNAEVLQHELVMLDAKSASRDVVIWSAANGKSIGKPDDSNVPQAVAGEDKLAVDEQDRLDDVCGRKGRREHAETREGSESKSLRVGRYHVPRADQSRADGCGHEGPHLGGGLGNLSKMATGSRNARPSAHPARRQSRRRRGQSGYLCIRAQSHGIHVLERRRDRSECAKHLVFERHRR